MNFVIGSDPIMKTITLNCTVNRSNDELADELRGRLSRSGTLFINVMSAAGSGKTTLLSRIITDMRGVKFGVMEADIASDVDAVKMEAIGAKALQVNTSGMCHMDAGMTQAAFDALDGAYDSDIVFLENVGNLICPAEYDTGAHINLMLLSVPEGDDKPLKYPLMFGKSDILVITKTDALPYFDFDVEKCSRRAKALNPELKIFPVSAKTGDGMPELCEYLDNLLNSLKGIEL